MSSNWSWLCLVIVLCSINQSYCDYYTTLGIKRHATTKEIRSAFKRLALSTHPDKNKVNLTHSTQLKETIMDRNCLCFFSG